MRWGIPPIQRQEACTDGTSDKGPQGRIAGGFINASLSSPAAIPLPVARLDDPTPASERAFFRYVHRTGISAIIVERAASEKWMFVFGKLGMRGTTVGGVTVYRVNSGHWRA